MQGIHTVPSANLVLRDDDLSAVGILGTRNRVLEDTNSTNNPALFEDTDLATVSSGLARTEVAGVTNDLLGLDSLRAGPHSHELAVSIGDDLVYGLVEHVGSAVNSRQTGERLGKFSETVERVDIWRLAPASHG